MGVVLGTSRKRFSRLLNEMLTKLNLAVYFLSASLAIWQPWPWIGRTKHGPLSWWFYERTIKDYNRMYNRSKFGLWWANYWWGLAKKYHPKKHAP